MQYEGASQPDRTEVGGSVVSGRWVDVAVGTLVVAACAYGLRHARETYSWADDLRLIQQVGSWGGLFDPRRW